MHTARLLTVSPSLQCGGGGGGLPCQAGLLANRGSALPGGSSCQGGLLVRGEGGLPCQGGWGGGIPECTEALWTEFLTHATENITLPQSSFEGGKKGKPLEPHQHRCLFLKRFLNSMNKDTSGPNKNRPWFLKTFYSVVNQLWSSLKHLLCLAAYIFSRLITGCITNLKRQTMESPINIPNHLEPPSVSSP